MDPTWTPNMDPQHGPPTWTPNMDPQHGPPTWTPNMDPQHGPPTWTPNMDPKHGPQTWTPNMDPQHGPEVDTSISAPGAWHTYERRSPEFRISSWSYDVEGHAKKCVERCSELANKTTLYIDDFHFKEDELKSVGELSKSKYALKLFWNDYTWHVLEDPIFCGQWTCSHDPSENGPRLVTNAWIDWFHTLIILVNTNKCCHVGNTAKQCRLGLFQDSDFAWDLEDSKSTSGGTLCVFGSHTFVPISWMCKKQTAVSHSSTESEIISLDTGLRFGWFVRSGTMGFNCFCPWKCFSCFRSNGATCEWEKQIS